MNNKDILVTPANIQGELIRNEIELNDLQFQAFKEQKYNELLKENQQLKEENERLQEQKDFWRKEFADERQQRNLYKSVIDEVREVINKMTHYGYEKNGTYYMRTTDNSEFGARAEILLQILDKVKDVK